MRHALLALLLAGCYARHGTSPAEGDDAGVVARCPPPSPCEMDEEDTLSACRDGCDNDGDGFTDCADFGCTMGDDPGALAYCAEPSEATVEQCCDGVDNDGDGFVDCGDFSCSRSEDPAVRDLCARDG